MRGRRVLMAGVGIVVVAVAIAGVGRSLGWFGGSTGGCERGPHQEVAPPSAGDAPEVDLPASAVRPIATGLCAPWGLAFLPDGSALVTERDTTRILSVTADGRVTEVQRLSEARPRGEGGLLGIAVSPRYATDRWVYVYYTTQTDNRIARLRLGEAPQPILTGIPVGDFHQGGRLAFGPDGMLYAAVGETWVAREIAQDRNSLGGKILRITPEGRPAPATSSPAPRCGASATSCGSRRDGLRGCHQRARTRQGPPEPCSHGMTPTMASAPRAGTRPRLARFSMP